MQQNYDFRQEMLQVHRPGLRDNSYQPEAGTVSIDDSFSIVIPKNAGEVLITVAKDLQDYLFTSMECSVPVRQVADLSRLPEKAILVATAQQLKIVWPYEAVSASFSISPIIAYTASSSAFSR